MNRTTKNDTLAHHQRNSQRVPRDLAKFCVEENNKKWNDTRNKLEQSTTGNLDRPGDHLYKKNKKRLLSKWKSSEAKFRADGFRFQACNFQLWPTL